MFKVQRRSTGVRRVSRESDLAGITWFGVETWYLVYMEEAFAGECVYSCCILIIIRRFISFNLICTSTQLNNKKN